MNKLNPNKIGLTTATAFGVLYIVCVILFLLVPNQALTWASYMMHGIDITKISMPTRISGTTAIGFIEVLLLGYSAGFLFGSVYNFVDKKF
ncbi:MAG: hypothetical protein J4428_01025 [Candidatus Aenigmarchaeota archaeon]|nr:hypothetical protein [Candidatus Aenigmarchaeota archaeon]